MLLSLPQGPLAATIRAAAAKAAPAILRGARTWLPHVAATLGTLMAMGALEKGYRRLHVRRRATDLVRMRVREERLTPGQMKQQIQDALAAASLVGDRQTTDRLTVLMTAVDECLAADEAQAAKRQGGAPEDLGGEGEESPQATPPQGLVDRLKTRLRIARSESEEGAMAEEIARAEESLTDDDFDRLEGPETAEGSEREEELLAADEVVGPDDGSASHRAKGSSGPELSHIQSRRVANA